MWDGWCYRAWSGAGGSAEGGEDEEERRGEERRGEDSDEGTGKVLSSDTQSDPFSIVPCQQSLLGASRMDNQSQCADMWQRRGGAVVRGGVCSKWERRREVWRVMQMREMGRMMMLSSHICHECRPWMANR